MPMLQGCLNGPHTANGRAGVPVTPAHLAQAASDAVAAGADSLHVHPKDDRGHDSVDPECVGAALTAIRRAVAGVSIGVTTGAWTEPDPIRRVQLVAGWEELPDFASVNWHEPGAKEVARALLNRGVGVEAGLWYADVAERFARDPLAPECLRILIEVTEQDVHSATATAAAIERVVHGLGSPLLLHGEGDVAWPMVGRALRCGLDTRIGLEDTASLPDGTPTRSNGELVSAVRARIAAVGAADERLMGRSVRVASRHRPPDRAPIRVNTGDQVRVGERDDEWPAFVLLTMPDDGSGWVPSRHLAVSGGGKAVAARDYDTTELDVDIGVELIVIEADTLSGWLWCRRPGGRCGWLPVTRLDPLDLKEPACDSQP